MAEKRSRSRQPESDKGNDRKRRKRTRSNGQVADELARCKMADVLLAVSHGRFNEPN